MKQEIKVLIGIVLSTLVILVVGVVIAGSQSKPSTTPNTPVAVSNPSVLIKEGLPQKIGTSTSFVTADEVKAFTSNLTSSSSNAMSFSPTGEASTSSPELNGTSTNRAFGRIKADQVTLVEFADLECPSCKAYSPILQKITETYGDKVRLIYRTFAIHENAPKDALVQVAAQNQGKFWEMTEMLFDKQDEWTAFGVDQKKIFDSYAQALGLDLSKFDQDLLASSSPKIVQNDIQDGQTLGLDRTPTLFIDGNLTTGAMSFESLSSLIDAELAKK